MKDAGSIFHCRGDEWRHTNSDGGGETVFRHCFSCFQQKRPDAARECPVSSAAGIDGRPFLLCACKAELKTRQTAASKIYHSRDKNHFPYSSWCVPMSANSTVSASSALYKARISPVTSILRYPLKFPARAWLCKTGSKGSCPNTATRSLKRRCSLFGSFRYCLVNAR